MYRKVEFLHFISRPQKIPQLLQRLIIIFTCFLHGCHVINRKYFFLTKTLFFFVSSHPHLNKAASPTVTSNEEEEEEEGAGEEVL